MARPIDLVTTVSTVMGLAQPSVAETDRQIRAGGLRASGGRGNSAAQMSSADGAALITAVLTAPQANKSVEAVKAYQRTAPKLESSSAGLFANSGIAELKALAPQSSFFDAIRACIDAYSPKGSLARRGGSQNGPAPKIEIHACSRSVSGRIRVSGLQGRHVAFVEYSAIKSKAITGMVRAGDLEEIRWITERTIHAIAKTLSEEKHNE